MNHSGSDTYFSVHLVNLAVRKQYATIYLTFLIFPRRDLDLDFLNLKLTWILLLD